jgi:hypothetical protein
LIFAANAGIAAFPSWRPTIVSTPHSTCQFKTIQCDGYEDIASKVLIILPFDETC